MGSSRRQFPQIDGWLLVIVVVGFVVGAIGIAEAIQYLTQTSGAISLQAPDGMNATISGVVDQNMERNFPTSGTVEYLTASGNISFFSSGAAAATVAVGDITGAWTNVTAVTADPNTITINPGDKPSAVVGQEITAFAYTATQQADDASVDFVYTSSGGPGRATVQGVAASTTMYAIDQDTGEILDSESSSSGGVITFDSLSSGTHDVVIQTGVNVTPQVSNPSPTGALTSPQNQISVDVTDGNFPQGDTVDVTISLDGSQIHTETLTSNGTVTVSIPQSGKTGGSHSWSVTATDDYGGSTSDSYTYQVPSVLEIRQETPPHDLVDGNSTNPLTVEAIFYEDVEQTPVIINRTVTDGTIDLTGLPVSSEFSVQVQAAGYHNRTIRIADIYSQSQVFMIQKTEPTVENRFVLADRTGNFPADETELYIQAAVNQSLYGSGGFEWMTVAGDDLGADEAFTDNLIDGKRYRILVQNDAGDTRLLGAYTAETTGTIQLNIGSVVLDPTAPGTVGINSTWINTTGGTPTVRVEYNDTTMNTSTLWVEIYQYKNQSNHLVTNTSFNGPFGTFSLSEPVPVGENDTTWVVRVVGEKPGDNIVYQRIVGPGQPVLQGLPGWFVTIVFVAIIWMVAGLFSQLNGGIGGLVVAGLGGMFYFMNLVPSYLGAGVVVLSMLTAGMLFLRERRGGL